MPAALLALGMSSSFFNPSFAFSSHFDPDGAPLSELSWSSSLAVVAVSFSGLFTAIVLMLACLCCKKGGIGFKEFENAEGDERAADFSAQGSPAAAAQNGPDVYVLPLTEVSLPMAKQPGRSVQLLRSTDLGRHSLLYLKEIGHGWFGKVFLGEVTSGVSSTQVVVKELQASASVQEQMQFLDEAQPYRALQHSNLLQCLAQCAEVTPYLLVMEFCPLGDLKGYLRSCRVTESVAPDPLTLQRMACEVACGIVHLHRNNYVHSDLALRNCLLTADLTVKIGDYGLSHCKYREDYFVAAGQLWVPLRWLAPELVDEVHGNLLVADQTRAGNVWSLGVTIWELFELGTQPYPHHSDRQVLAYTIREQQLKLPKPQLPLTLSDRWYEVMQFCWLQPEQRPTAEEVHLLLSYLCAKGTTEAEEDFQRRWRSLQPSGGGAGPGPGATGPALGSAAELAASSFPLLEQFAGDGFHVDGDDVLTVTETRHGLNFEYKWEAGHGTESFPPPGAMPSPGHPACLQELCAPDSAPPGVLPVLSAHSPSLGSEYFIRLEETMPVAGHDSDCAGCTRSPRPNDADDDSEGSATTSLAMEPLLGHAPPACDHSLHRSQPQDPLCPSPGPSMLTEPGAENADWGLAAFCPPLFEDPLGASPLGSSRTQPSPGEEELGKVEAQRAAQHRHWSSNMSANNNSGTRDPESWDPGYSGSYAGDRPSPKQPPRTSPEPAHPLALEDPREPLLRPQVASPGQEPGGCIPLPHLCPAQGLAPTASLVTSPGMEVIVSGGGGCQAEPMLAEEADGSAGPQLLPPSIPSPSQEGALLPSEDAGAPNSLPASPTPAAAEPTRTLSPSSSSSPKPEAPSSEDEATSGVFTDLSGDGPQAEKPDVGPAFRSLQKQAGTPDSLDSLDIPSSASDGGCEGFSPLAAGTPGGQPRALDSGYDTENYESPEFVLKEAHELCVPEVLGGPASEGGRPGPEAWLPASPGGLGGKSPHRDSAYFSDLDVELEKGRGVQCPGPEQGLESPRGPGPRSVQAPLGPGELLPRDEPSPEPSGYPLGPGPQHPRSQGPAGALPVPSPRRSKFFLLSSEGDGAELQGAPRERTGRPGSPRAPPCPALPGVPAAVEGRLEEEEDSEESDESDEELRCYSVQEPSEDSEEDAPAVPVVVAESQSARHLRGLLKVPGPLPEAFCEDLERKKKAVSFFDDVTVYLFDQESPTREPGPPLPGADSPGAPCRPRRAQRPPDGCASDGGGFRWRDDFALAPAPAPAPAAAFPRFTVSPAPASRFSITHVSDLDADSVGGDQE